MPVDVDSGERKQRKQRKSVFEVAEFETGFWEEVIGRMNIQHGEGTRDGRDEVLAEGLILVLLGAESGHGEDPETMLRNSVPMLMGAGRARSTLFKVDESRPCPPSVRGKKEEAGLQPSEKRYLCLVSWSQCPR